MYAFYDGERLIGTVELDGRDIALAMREALEESGERVSRIEYRRFSGAWTVAWEEGGRAGPRSATPPGAGARGRRTAGLPGQPPGRPRECRGDGR